VESKRADLTRPQGDKGTEGIASLEFCPGHLFDGSSERNGESAAGTGLDLDLGHFKRAESDVGEHLGGGGTSQPDGRLVFVGKFLASKVGVGILEDFIETIFEHALR
jgi:hypothetical protein